MWPTVASGRRAAGQDRALDRFPIFRELSGIIGNPHIFSLIALTILQNSRGLLLCRQRIEGGGVFPGAGDVTSLDVAVEGNLYGAVIPRPFGLLDLVDILGGEVLVP